jgi:hypothetical protein
MLGKSKSEGDDRYTARNARRISRQRGASDTTWDFLAFMRTPEIVHVAAASSTADQRASRVSPLRAAVKMSHSNASRVAGQLLLVCSRLRKSGTCA